MPGKIKAFLKECKEKGELNRKQDRGIKSYNLCDTISKNLGAITSFEDYDTLNKLVEGMDPEIAKEVSPQLVRYVYLLGAVGEEVFNNSTDPELEKLVEPLEAKYLHLMIMPETDTEWKLARQVDVREAERTKSHLPKY